MKTISLLKAVLTQDMNMFKYKTTSKKKTNKILVPILLFLIVASAIGSYAYMIGESLHPVNLTYVMLTMFILLVTILTFTAGIYKSQGILFDTKDNDLLFSLQIKKSKILFIRILKLLIFQYIYNLMFLLPAFVIYIYFEKPSIDFYLISLLMTFLLPIIPTIASSILGYIAKMISSKSNKKRLVQTVVTLLIFIAIFILSYNLNKYLENIATHAKSINEVITKTYLPAGLYIDLITNYKTTDLIKILLINIIPLAIFIYIGQKYYFKIVFNSKEAKISNQSKPIKYNKNTKLKALVIKELKRYLSSPIYMMNTAFGYIIILVLSIALCFNDKIINNLILSQYGLTTNISITFIYFCMVLIMISMTSITSSSISLEGKTINITKSLPIKTSTIMKSKIIFPFIIELPFIILSEIIFFIKFTPTIQEEILIILTSLVTIAFQSVLGLIINLKYPKLNASSDTEVVKQSMSATLSVFLGLGVSIILILIMIKLNKILTIPGQMLISLIILTSLTTILYIILMNKTSKEYQKLNI